MYSDLWTILISNSVTELWKPAVWTSPYIPSAICFCVVRSFFYHGWVLLILSYLFTCSNPSNDLMLMFSSQYVFSNITWWWHWLKTHPDLLSCLTIRLSYASFRSLTLSQIMSNIFYKREETHQLHRMTQKQHRWQSKSEDHQRGINALGKICVCMSVIVEIFQSEPTKHDMY